MGIAIDFTTAIESTTRPTSLLIPELIYEIERYLEIQDLAAAALVCRAWHEAWSSSLYSTVRCHIRRTSAPLGVVASSLDPKKTTFHSFAAAPPTRDNQGYLQHQYYSLQHQHLHHQVQQHQQYIPPFLNFQKYGRWIRSLEIANLYCLPSVSLPCQTGAVSSHSSSSSTSSSSAFSPASLPSPVQDHLSQIQSCWHLIQLDISRTVMSLERLDDLLSSLPRLKVFKFEVVNKTEIATANGLHGGGSSSNGGGSPGSSFRRGYMQQQPSSLLLKKPKQVTLESLEPEVIRVIARRLGGQLERLDLVFTVTGRIGLSTFLELLTNCRSTLKSLTLTRAEVYQTDYSRERHAAMEISALLASLLGTTSTTTTSSSSSSSTTSPPSSSSSSSSPSLPPALECLSFNSCAIPDREFEWFLRHAPQLRELNLHDCRFLNRPAVAAILQHSPLLETLSLRSVPYIDADALKQLFEVIPRSGVAATTVSAVSWLHHAAGSHASGTTATSGVNGSGGVLTSTMASSNNGGEKETMGLRLKSIRLAYLRQLNDTVMETIARYQGASLEKLSVQWCPHVTDVGILPIFMFCQRLQDLSLYLSKPTLNIFKDLTDEPANETATGTTTTTVTEAATTTAAASATATATEAAAGSTPFKRRLWACANTLERLEVGGQMFVDRIRSSSEHLQPQLYHHLSPNPHHMRSPSGNQDLSLGGGVGGGIGGAGGNNATNNGGPGNATNTTTGTTTNSNNVIHDPYSIAHYQGYPMYHLWRYNRLSDPFRELQAQLETLPRLKHLGVQAKGIEHLLRRGFGPNVHIQSLALLNQQGRMWSPEEIREMFEHMPHLRTLVCEKSTIMAGGSSLSSVVGGGSGSCGAGQLKGVDLLKRQMRMRRILEDHHVELVQSTLSPMTI
ncbi:hypothetical protein BGZ96_005111 [Linnemannia gamsii]|uniref:F-box domain-containing protein n=1 Tax=Linnemannia gamsii TaxID=64522 RepID=A0ABQ7K5X5_9FUNG|nr:hypothetical protein BGZ96_005111 [Linnemannia gamsii]